jgi:hypothetical protein
MLLCAAGAGAYYYRSGVFLKQGGADEESIKQLNRVLQGIKK